MKHVILFEFIDEVEAYIKEFGRDSLLSKNLLIVALDAKVRAFLLNRGIHCESTLGYFNYHSHCLIVEKTNQLLKEALSKAHFTDNLGLSETYKHFFAYHVKFYLNYFCINLEIIDQIYQQHRFEQISCYSNKKIVSKAFIDPEERFLGNLIQRFCVRKAIDVCFLNVDPKKKK